MFTNGGGTAEIDGNQARLAVPAVGASYAMLHSTVPAASNGNTTLSYRFDSTASSSRLRVYQRFISGTDNYRLEIDSASSTARIYRTVWGNTAQIGSFTVPVDTDTHRARFEVTGSTVRAKVWDDGDPEPGAWSVSVSDSSLVGNGRPRVAAAYISGSANAVTVDDWSHTNPTSAPAAHVSYGWNADGQLTGETLASGGARSWSWANGRLTGFSQTGYLRCGAEHRVDLRLLGSDRDGVHQRGHDHLRLRRWKPVAVRNPLIG